MFADHVEINNPFVVPLVSHLIL